MNRKQYKILLVILIAIVIINTAFIISADSNVYSTEEIGTNVNGTVYKITAGNNQSEDVVTLILGIHPREHQIHEAVNSTLADICGEDGSQNLTKKYVIYYVDINDNITSREDTRPAGEGLASQFIVPNIKSDNPFIVVDIHEIDATYEYANFIYSISNTTEGNEYAQEIAEKIDVAQFNFTEGTSPEKVTIPIAEQGVTTLLFETSTINSYDEKMDVARSLIYALDNLQPRWILWKQIEEF